MCIKCESRKICDRVGKKTRKNVDIYRKTTMIGIVHLIVKFTTRVFPLFSHSSFNSHTPFFLLQNIEFALGQGKSSLNTGSSNQHSARIQEELRTLILKRKARNDEVFNWIDVSKITFEYLLNHGSGLMTYVFNSRAYHELLQGQRYAK